jgi:RHS repeat-associated protein
VEQRDTAYLYDGWNMIAEVDANNGNATLRTYVWGTDLSGSRTGAGGVGGLLWVNNAQSGLPMGIQFAAYDGNGNVAGLFAASDGSSTARYEYGPFGEPIRMTGTLAKANPVRWSTKVTDDEGGLVYYGYRYYNPSTGRWPNRDPINELGFKVLTERYEPINWNEEKNLYCLIGNDPLNRYDLFGLKSCCCNSGFWTAEVSYRVIGLMYVHGSFTGKVICSSDKSVTASVSGSADGMGVQAGLIKGKSKVGFWGKECKDLVGQTAGIFLASVGFGVGPINIIGISGNVGSAPEKLVSGDIDVDIGPSTDFSAGDLLEKPKPGFGGGGGFIGLRIKKVD